MRQRLAMTAIFCGLVIGFIPIVSAQTTDTATDQRITALEARVAALERREGITSPTTAPSATIAASPAAPVAAAAPSAPVVAPAPPADWSALHRGMTQRQVIAVLGNPGNKQVMPMSETWYYDGDRRVQFDRNGYLDSWSVP